MCLNSLEITIYYFSDYLNYYLLSLTSLILYQFNSFFSEAKINYISYFNAK